MEKNMLHLILANQIGIMHTLKGMAYLIIGTKHDLLADAEIIKKTLKTLDDGLDALIEASSDVIKNQVGNQDRSHPSESTTSP